jgi:hypothetical protein
MFAELDNVLPTSLQGLTLVDYDPALSTPHFLLPYFVERAIKKGLGPVVIVSVHTSAKLFRFLFDFDKKN